MPFTLAQISDTHLGARTALFRANFDRVVAELGKLQPHEIVATGDVSLDGADQDSDLRFAAECLNRLPVPARVLPGNHDVGDHPKVMPRQPVTNGRLARWHAQFGPDCWMHDREGWRLLGLDSQVMGTHPDEHAQAAFIADALATLGGKRLAVFLHKPVFVADPVDEPFDYWSVPATARGPLHAVMAHPALRLVASGHLHVHHEATRGAVRYAWAPAVSFIVSPDEQAGLPGGRPCGLLVHEFGTDTVQTRLLVPDGMEHPYVHEVFPNGYPAGA